VGEVETNSEAIVNVPKGNDTEQTLLNLFEPNHPVNEQTQTPHANNALKSPHARR